MAAKAPTQKAKLALKAIPYSITTDVKNDYYVSPKIQKNLSMDDLAASQLYPNSPSRVGFVMPASAPDQSEWEVTLCTPRLRAWAS